MTLQPINHPTDLEIGKSAAALVPLKDPRMQEFLAYRALGFNQTEACNLLGIHRSIIAGWRTKEPRFLEMEENLHELREELATKAINIAYLRNFVMVMEKDRRILQKAIEESNKFDDDGNELAEDEKVELTKEEREYLHKIRGQYTPVQLQMLKEKSGLLDKLPEFSEFVMGFHKGKNGSTEMKAVLRTGLNE